MFWRRVETQKNLEIENELKKQYELQMEEAKKKQEDDTARELKE